MYTQPASTLATGHPPRADDGDRDRVDLRTTKGEKRRHQQLAALAGRSLSDFYRGAVNSVVFRVDVNKNVLAEMLRIVRYIGERYPNDTQVSAAVKRVLQRYGRLI